MISADVEDAADAEMHIKMTLSVGQCGLFRDLIGDSNCKYSEYNLVFFRMVQVIDSL